MGELDARVQARKDANSIHVSPPTAVTSPMKISLAILVLVAVIGLLQAVTRIAQPSKSNQTLKPANLSGMPRASTSPESNSYLAQGDQYFERKRICQGD